MSLPVAALLSALLGAGGALSTVWYRFASNTGAEWRASGLGTALGFVTNFLDTLGIGSFAPTTAFIKLKRLIADEHIPGTLNVGHSLPTIAQAVIFTTTIEVAPGTLLGLVLAAVLGAWFGSRFIAHLPRRHIQMGMAMALLAAAAVLTMTNLKIFPGGGDATSLQSWPLALACLAHALYGALSALGIGIYAPSLITLSLLGMNPLAAFPIMTGSGALAAAAAGIRFLRVRRFDHRLAVSLALGGLPGVLLAAFVVKSLPLYLLRWLVVCVVAYAAVAMLRSALRPQELERTASVAAQSWRPH